MSCNVCEKIKLKDSFKDVAEYAETVRLLDGMVKNGELEAAFLSCPFDRVFGNPDTGEIAFYSRKMFHQVRCKKCGTIYGLICDTMLGDGQLKINSKVFNPADYPDKE